MCLLAGANTTGCALLQVHDDLGIAESLETLGLIWHSREPSTAAQLLGAGPGWTKHNGPCDLAEYRNRYLVWGRASSRLS